MTPQLNAALAKAKKGFPQILANRRVKIPTKSGREISFTYAELEEIAESITPMLSENGLCLSSQMRYLENGKFCLVTTLRHESGEFLESFFPLPESVGDAKDLGSQISYGRRYNVLCLLEISIIEPNGQQWQETKRVIANEIRQEINGAPSPTKAKKENGGLLEAISEDSPKQQTRLQATGASIQVPGNGFNARIAATRTVLGIDREVIIKWLKGVNPAFNEPSQLNKSQCDILVKSLCLTWANSRYKNSYHANNSYEKRVLGAINEGKTEVEAIKEWMQYADSLVQEKVEAPVS
ncbi:hypothetical protein CAL7716_085920 [Calothrix sp. PCC 7716]|nr:hypothetical protein CAL7716_085920 [Calothrix sp. PCC 7716]